ncbi:MAG TPA: M20/M25/M40 family metallo-hydrolase [Gemmatimonadales bacterium]|nr:M20/M25/M40 family metallo-hydrolase [Gemmatimonadales bacterium]
MSLRRLVIPLALVAAAPLAAQDPPRVREAESVLRTLVESYGASGMESPVRDAIRTALPSWARPEVDTAGNLVLSVGQGEPTVVFIAHMDEVGFRVRAVAEDGTLEVEPLGGLFLSLWEGRPALVHTGSAAVPGVFQPREPGAPEARQPPALRVDLGSGTRAGIEALGIRPGHTVTSPKEYVRLAGFRATGRAFDDRIGCAAQILAVRRLDPTRLRHTVVFVWSTREEIGLEGARAAARGLGIRPARVHAVDTFVSADSPLERQGFAVAPLGRGPVARALDNSSVTPPALLDSLAALARARGIPLQIGTTNGGNDGSVFGEYGVPGVPLAWPLRYSHSPVEVADLRDVVALAELVRVVAEGW